MSEEPNDTSDIPVLSKFLRLMLCTKGIKKILFIHKTKNLNKYYSYYFAFNIETHRISILIGRVQ